MHQTNQTQVPIAHVLPGGPEHILDEHLQEVAKLAQTFAADFGSGDWAYLAGLWHDLGKYRRGFQERIRFENRYDPDAHIDEAEDENTKLPEGKTGRGDRHPHANAGALHAIRCFEQAGLKNCGRILAYLIAGHHAGLTDWHTSNVGNKALSKRLEKDGNALQELAESIEGGASESILNATLPSPASVMALLKKVGDEKLEGLALWIRMLFSCLVDADSLDTERFYDKNVSDKRSQYRSLSELLNAFNDHMADLAANATNTPVNAIRADILRQCRAKAREAPGIFTLTVPTGGGKTLSSLAFALEHAKLHGLKRVIYAIPYTSIIEQTADVFRKVFGKAVGFDEQQVVEHHSNLDPDKQDHKSRLATENWDAPIIVTTNVQLFESLFGAKKKHCRKLHNIIQSVIVLDEAQTVSRDYLSPILQAIRLLTAHYRVSCVLSTATQPMLEDRYDCFKRLTLKGLYKSGEQNEIIADQKALYNQLKRVEIKPMKDSWNNKTTWDELADRLAEHDCVLAIVNTRPNCRELYERLMSRCDQGEVVHLSGLMCGEHRSDVINDIKKRLENRRQGIDTRPLRVVSTQLVEAGVDFDFPVVYRAMAGLDSIAQAAGRCNREGKLAGLGQVYVFDCQTKPPVGLLRQGYDVAHDLIVSGRVTDPLAPESHIQYFDHLYEKGALDKHDICNLQSKDVLDNRGQIIVEIPFRTIADAFKLITDEGESIIVPYKKTGEDNSRVDGWLKQLADDPSQKWVYRKLQRYTVNVHSNHLQQLLKERCLEDPTKTSGLYVALDSCYDSVMGLGGQANYSPDSLMF